VLIQAGVLDSAYVLRLQKQNGSDVFVVRGSGNVGIGTSTASNLLTLGASGGPTMRLIDTSSAAFGLIQSGSNGDFIISADHGNAGASTNIIFKSDGATERMRIDSSGNLLVGTTSASTPFDGCRIAIDANSSDGIRVRSSGVPMRFIATGTSTFVGSISTTASTTSYNTSSDHRLKENVTADWDATTRLKQLNPVRFNFISDADTTVDGFLAHEVQDIVPEAISGTKDAVDEDGNPVMQGIDQSKLVPLLVKTIQELEARITALEAN
jgi:hypothetical protein